MAMSSERTSGPYPIGTGAAADRRSLTVSPEDHLRRRWDVGPGQPRLRMTSVDHSGLDDDRPIGRNPWLQVRGIVHGCHDGARPDLETNEPGDPPYFPHCNIRPVLGCGDASHPVPRPGRDAVWADGIHQPGLHPDRVHAGDRRHRLGRAALRNPRPGTVLAKADFVADVREMVASPSGRRARGCLLYTSDAADD